MTPAPPTAAEASRQARVRREPGPLGEDSP